MKRTLVLFSVLMLIGFLASAQTRVVTGIVKDESGAPVPFATVTETGTRNATTADANGNFSIKMKGTGSLSFSAAGFAASDVTPEGGVANAVLKRNNTELATVTVTGYGIRRQARSIGTPVTRIDNKDLTEGKVTNVATGLSGKVSGLQIAN